MEEHAVLASKLQQELAGGQNFLTFVALACSIIVLRQYGGDEFALIN